MTTVTAADVATVLGSYDAIAERDLEGILARVAADAVLETRLETYSGREALERYYHEAFQTGFSTAQEALIVLDDRVVGLSELRLQGHGAGMSSDQLVAEIWTMVDGLATHMRVMGRDEALETLDLADRVARVRQLIDGYDAFNRGDFDTVMAAMAPDVELNRGEVSMETSTVAGIDQVRKYLEPDIFASQHAEVIRVVDADRRVMVETSVEIRGAGSGIELSTPGFTVWTLRAGKATHADFFQTREAAPAFLLEAEEEN